VAAPTYIENGGVTYSNGIISLPYPSGLQANDPLIKLGRI